MLFFSLTVFSQTSDENIETTGYFVLDCMDNDTLFRSMPNLNEYKRVEFRDNTDRYNYGEFGPCVLPKEITKFTALDSLITHGVGLVEELNTLPQLSFLSTDAYYIPKIPQLKSIHYSAVGDSLPANIFDCTKLESLSYMCTGEKIIGFDDYKEQNLVQPNDWSYYMEEVSKIKSLKSLKIDKAFDGYNLSIDTISSLPESFCEMKNLSRLELLVPGVVHIPASISKLSNLHYLKIRSGEEELPSEFSKLQLLDTLIISGDSRFPNEKVIYPNLKVLACSNSYLPLLPELRYLEFTGDSLSENILVCTKMDSIFYSSYNSNNPLALKSSLNSFTIFSKLKSLKSISYSNYTLDKGFVPMLISLASTFKNVPDLKTIKVRGRSADKKLIDELTDAYKKHGISFQYSAN